MRKNFHTEHPPVSSPETGDSGELDAFVKNASAEIADQTSNLAEAMYLFQCRLNAVVRRRASSDMPGTGEHS
jgi:hypothetical protein